MERQTPNWDQFESESFLPTLRLITAHKMPLAFLRSQSQLHRGYISGHYGKARCEQLTSHMELKARWSVNWYGQQTRSRPLLGKEPAGQHITVTLPFGLETNNVKKEPKLYRVAVTWYITENDISILHPTLLVNTFSKERGRNNPGKSASSLLGKKYLHFEENRFG